MPRPPMPGTPLSIFSRSAYEWIGRIGHKHKELNELKQSERARSQLLVWTDRELMTSVLSLNGNRLDRDLFDKTLNEYAKTGSVSTELGLRLDRLFESVRNLRESASKPEAELDLQLLMRLNPAGSALRTTNNHAISKAVDAACRWFTADSFRELNPVEQAALVLLRLIELQPFESGNEETAVLASSFFTMRAGLPAVLLPTSSFDRYRSAIQAGAAMNTTPMVEVIAASIESTLDQMITIVKSAG